MDALRCDAPRVLYFNFVRAFGRKDEAVVSRRCPLLALESRMHDFMGGYVHIDEILTRAGLLSGGETCWSHV